MTLTIGSLFSGYGGLDMAVGAFFDAETKWFVEFDEAPSKVLAHHWPHVPNLGDVTKVDWAQVEPVDIITGGSPCQDLSAAGKRAGMTEGTRSNLWVNMREAINIIRPRLVVWENVLGALSAEATSDSDMEPGTGLLGDGGGRHLRALGRVLGDLAEIGYDATWTTLRASDIGAPHHRARVFLIARPQVPDTEGSRRDHGTAAHIGAANREKHAPGHDSHAAPDPGRIGLEAGRPPGRSEAEVAGDHDRERPLSDTLGAGWGERREPAPGEAQGRRPHSEPDGRGDDIHWGDYAPAVRRWERNVGPAPAPTEPNSKGNPRLNAAFAEWMMGLPAGHVTGTPGLSRADQLKAVGNGVVPQQAFAALELLMNIDEGN